MEYICEIADEIRYSLIENGVVTMCVSLQGGLNYLNLTHTLLYIEEYIYKTYMSI